MKRTTKLDFEKFKDSFLKWQEKLNLMDWKVYFEHVPLKDSFADISWDHNGAVATVRMSSELRPENYAEFDPVKNGLHEALHLLLAHFQFIAESRYVRPDDILDCSERLTRILERILL